MVDKYRSAPLLLPPANDGGRDNVEHDNAATDDGLDRGANELTANGATSNGSSSNLRMSMSLFIFSPCALCRVPP